MTVTEHVDPLNSGRLPDDEPLPVDGVLPLGLDGTFLSACAPPAGSHVSAGALLSGVRLGGGTARWHRATGEPGGRPPGPAIWIRPTGPAEPPPDGPCRASVAPPVRDHAAAEWHTVATYPGLDLAEHLVIGPDGRVLGSRPFALDGAPLMRAVALTDRFVVVFDLPVTYRRAAAMIGEGSPYRWQHGRRARIGLLPRRAGGEAEPLWFPIDPCFVTESVNAHDDGGRVVVDAVRIARAYDTPSWTPGDAAGSSRVHRWTLDLASGTAHERELTGALDQASVDSRRAGSRHQLIFGRAPGGRALVGNDLAADTTQVRALAPGWRAGRPVFVPRGIAEGDGWILVLVRNAALRRAELLVLDALNLTGRPEAVVHLPGTLPDAGHTTWVPAGDH
ncbi:carotenoid oxygenase family protein [Sphaerisporangium viridialbum]|uniref:carotenoid oxygenase family protein n=1 Tax=Sphaerisporangium viridialbum TaxID=46189 RepID=UPI003C787F45